MKPSVKRLQVVIYVLIKKKLSCNSEGSERKFFNVLKELVFCRIVHFTVVEINGSKWGVAAKVRKWDLTNSS